jgi:hypothetical protein
MPVFFFLSGYVPSFGAWHWITVTFHIFPLKGAVKIPSEIGCNSVRLLFEVLPSKSSTTSWQAGPSSALYPEYRKVNQFWVAVSPKQSHLTSLLPRMSNL